MAAYQGQHKLLMMMATLILSSTLVSASYLGIEQNLFKYTCKIDYRETTMDKLGFTYWGGCQEWNKSKIVIYINKVQDRQDLIYTLYHELRHTWQFNQPFITTSRELSKYATVGAYRWLSMGTLKEIDADCFAKQFSNASYYYLEEYGDYCREVAE